MKLVSLDIEATGLDMERSQIIELGAIVIDFCNPDHCKWILEDPLKLPTFSMLVQHQEYLWQPGAYPVGRNKEIFDYLCNFKLGTDVQKEGWYVMNNSGVAHFFQEWLLKKGGFEKHSNKDYVKIVVGGKNAAQGDVPMLKRLPHWEQKIRIITRVVDPTSMYLNPWEDEEPPGLKSCLTKAGVEIPKEVSEDGDVPHTALWDSILTGQTIYKFYRDLYKK